MASIEDVAGVIDISGDYIRCGIYFLCRGAEIIYVGQSTNVYSRVFNHQLDRENHTALKGTKREKNFDRVYFLACDASQLDFWETKFIEHLKPRCNGVRKNGKFIVPNLLQLEQMPMVLS